MARLYYSKLQAVLDADISAGATTVTFTAPLKEWGEDNIATISAPDILAMWVGNELLHITAYTSGASTATVLRGQEGSTATAHAEGDILRNDATATDYELFSAGSPTETIQDIVGAMVTGGTETGISVTYDDPNGRLDFVAEVTQAELDAKVSDTAYDATSWNGVTDVAPSKNAVRDKIEDILDGVTFTGDISVPDEAYDATAWNGSLEVPTKNAVRDKIESLGGATVSDTAYGAGWDGDTTTAPSKNAVYDKIETLSGGGTPAVQVSHPTNGATRANTAFGSLSTAWTDSITVASNEDVDWTVDICYELSSATSTWFFALYVDGTMYDRIQVLYTSAAGGRPYHFNAGGVVEGLSAGSHTFEVKISTYASSTFTIRDTLDTVSAGDSLTATGRSSMRLRPVLAA